MYAVDGLPLNFIHGTGFRMLMHDVDPKIKIKSRRTYVSKLTTAINRDIIPRIKDQLGKIQNRYCHFSCDIWSTRRREGVLGIMAHYIDNDWTYKSTLIAFKALKDRHTGEFIHSSFLNCLKELNIPPKWVCT